jgi:hypothetical protein
MIVSGLVTKIIIEDNKKVYIEVILNKILAICFDGAGLIDEPQPYYRNTGQSLLDMQVISDNIEFFKNISNHSISGFIRKHDV